MKKTDLERRLEAYDLAGVSFYKAKKSLLKEGFSEQEITIASASHPFDGKKNEPKPPHPHTALYEKNPELAQESAQVFLEEDRAKSRQEAVRASLTMYAGSRHPLGSLNPISAQGITQSAYLLGIPLFKLVFLGIFITAILYGMSYTFHLFPLLYVGVFIRCYAALIVLLFLIMIVREGYKEIVSQKNSDRKKRILSIVSTLFLIGVSTYALVRIIGL